MSLNSQLGLRAPNRWSDFANPDSITDPIEPEFADGAQDLDAIAEQEGRDLVATATNIAEDAWEKGKEIASLAAGEGEKAVGALSRSTSRLDAQERVFSFMPNSILVYGLVGLGVYWLTKK